MANTDYIRNRTNDILRERIALGATQGGARRKKRAGSKCPKTKHPRRAYVNSYGTHVKRTCVKNRKRGGVLVGDGVHVGGSPFPVIDLISNLFAGEEPAEMGYKASGGARKRKQVRHRRAGVYAGDDMMGYGEGCYMGACPNKSHMMAGVRAGVRAGARCSAGSRKMNPWIQYVKHVQARDGVSYKDALQIASAERRGY
jgi:hypothetical protein